MKIAIEGCAHGELERIYDTIEGIEKERNIKIDLLLCCGDFQSTRNLADLQTMAVPRKYMDMCTFYKYYSGERVAPILTIFIGGNHEASNYLQELPYGGWVAPNIYYLGYAGVVNVNGIRIAGISGIYKGHDFLRGHHEFPPYTEKTCRSVYHVRQLEVFRLQQLSGKVDIFMSHDWPRGIHEYGNKAQLLRFKPHFAEDIEKGQLGSRPLEELLKTLQPTYWFAAHLHCKFAALVQHTRTAGKSLNEEESSSDSNSDSEEEEEEKHSKSSATAPAAPVAVTKFLALDKCLPKRRFLQVLDMPTSVESEKPTLEYDIEWLSILLTTNHLTSIKDNNYYLPGKKAGSMEERCNFTPTVDELSHIRHKFNNLEVPKNFCRTVNAFDADEQQNYKQMFVDQPQAQLNPQCNDFCAILGIDDPLCLAMLANGKDLPQTSSLEESTAELNVQETKDEDVPLAPTHRKLNLTLPAPITAEVDKNVIELPVEEDEEATSRVSDVEQDLQLSPSKRKLNLKLPAPTASEVDKDISEVPAEVDEESNSLPTNVAVDSTMNEQDFQLAPTKRKLNLTLPEPIASKTDNIISEVPVKVTEEKLEEPKAELPGTTSIKKLKRRNQSIYQADDMDD
ncbi:lariat debranching enzyme [Drosophila albomicans]|uniref:Lariat debranching enzyme n=1 Tax=Drosophila albomicans TaxID=7291 RepID=A0A6P8X9B5_DROAB|nr:lariat debranching enzyme [Drosophila albomicans]